MVAVERLNEAAFYERGAQTLVAAWVEVARGAKAATVRRLPGVVAAVFPEGPERLFYNNALIEPDVAEARRSDIVDVMEDLYAASGVTHFAIWMHERDHETRAAVEERGYEVAESTRAMVLTLDDFAVPEAEVDGVSAGWTDYLRFLAAFRDIPPGLLAGTDPTAFHALVGHIDGEPVAAAIALDVDGDCGIYNVETLEHARRRGLATALTTLHLHGARRRGCQTATLQSTPAAERLYAELGFRDLGRILEYVPPTSSEQLSLSARPGQLAAITSMILSAGS